MFLYYLETFLKSSLKTYGTHYVLECHDALAISVLPL